jgi:anti-sigma factor RsiW
MNDTLTHKEAFELLPWYVNRTLDEDERRDVRAHLSTCLVCRREVSFLERLDRVIVASPDVDFSPKRSLSGLLERIDAAEGPLARRLWAGLGSGLRALRVAHPVLRGALLVQAAVILLAAFLLLRAPLPGTAPSFETLTDAPVAISGDAGNTRLRVVFADDASVSEIQALLQGVDAHIVDGPSSVGAFAIDVPASAGENALDALRSSGRVRFAGPAVAGEPQ